MIHDLKLWHILIWAISLALVSGCASQSTREISEEVYGKTKEGESVKIYTLVNRSGAKAKITNYGGMVVSLEVPDKNGKLGDVVLGYDKLEDYVANNPYFGCLVGRYGNRIAKAKFKIGNEEYTLAANNGPNHLHGGIKGFDKVVWEAKPVQTSEGPALELTYLSKDGEEGYPGNLSVKAVYTLTNKNELKLDFTATTDKTTICNLTHHSYFNLADGGKSTILNHEVVINADKFTPVDETLITTGALPPVEGTPFDFRTPHTIGERINEANQQLQFGLGYDHNWVLNKEETGELSLAARVYEPKSGRVMEVHTTEPGLQFYVGNFLDGSNVGKGGVAYQHRTGFCMEPQHYPDSPNKPNFPSVILRPGETYKNTIIYAFSVKR